ncbi:SGS-domain-containing protein [Acaromyces ingoldii]|uniref:SGS-domain-containing protein n=1 Tax=Acaromyces ingoldii TaxID=215250 RepID=A0A316YJH2_9BASI|nr:SGS-domain-containing protein [Acaromyces ingoldii]PWN87875.1 SGS-domain-containing protein [Acaromyces ingoldii]
MAAPTAPSTPRHDFYQTDTVLTLSIYIKGLSPSDVSLSLAPTSMTFDVPSRAQRLVVEHLRDAIRPDESSFKVLATKVDVTLVKAQPARWDALEASPGSNPVAAASVSSSAASGVSTAPSDGGSLDARKRSTRNKWDTLDVDENGPGQGGEENGNGELQDFFQKLYADADDDTRRAMMKSYQESGGTHLSTNWGEVSKARVETKPPDGMEARKW